MRELCRNEKQMNPFPFTRARSRSARERMQMKGAAAAEEYVISWNVKKCELGEGEGAL